MSTQRDAGREFWRGVLVAGGLTTVPEWTLEPVPGVAEHVEAVAAHLVSALGERADEVGVPLRAALLAAHTAVLSALSGEKDVVTGYLTDGCAAPLPCRLSAEADSWRTLLVRTHRVESTLLEHRDFPVGALRDELTLVGPSSQVEYGSGSVGSTRADLAAGAVLRAEFLPGSDGSSLTLRLSYRTDTIDAGCAARIAGYHRAALEFIVADLDAAPARQSLLSAEELDFQVEGLAGPRRDLGDKRFHELFEDRVARHPDAVAGVHGETVWTYGELNAHANRLGRALLARGLNREDVVAVVTERNLDWMASVLAIFKAGGVYLPIEPHFPSDRIATTLKRAGAKVVVTEHASTATLDGALAQIPGLEKLYVDAAYFEGQREGDEAGGLGMSVSADQLAYIYFTSGSTGQPKGAMCEQAGMLNHLWAKIGDLGLGEGQVMAQIAPQCFDISLWQLVSALLQGGRTLLVEQDVILDVTRFIDKIVSGRVNVMQVVPSYLEVVCSYLEVHPRELPDLHCVSTTGEALKKELTQRWFAVQPGITIGNAYGLTETSDDVTHEVMDRVPDRERVPLGPAVINVHIYVVDEHLAPVPLGAPGEIVFSGVCVGRGYINDPERTAAAFMDDPIRPGERIYRSGDHGRWLPEGKLEFLGRRDTQVKIRGFRIEIGEIDNALLRVPGVRDGAVVVAQRADDSKHLVGFYAGPHQLDVGLIQDRLAESLPGYMVPAVFHRREQLPLTANGKIDTKALAVLAGELEAVSVSDYDAPATPTEIRLAAAFAKVLEVPVEQVSRCDDFFDRGSSLSAVKLAVTLERKVSLREITRNPVLADLAALLDEKLSGAADFGSAPGAALLQPLAVPRGYPQSEPAEQSMMVRIRHDYISANRHSAETPRRPPVVRLSAPVTVVIAADDPSSTAGSGQHYGD
jgi:amino acid adenylation domain-containing protein